MISSLQVSTPVDVDGDNTPNEAIAQQLFSEKVGQKQPETDPNNLKTVPTDTVNKRVARSVC